jgi:hypothetical protein
MIFSFEIINPNLLHQEDGGGETTKLARPLVGEKGQSTIFSST